MGRDTITGLMEEDTGDSGLEDKWKDREHISGQTEENILASSIRIINRVLEE